MKNILVIGGSDSSGGAGIQGDLKTIAAHNLHGLTAITAITSQNTKEISYIEESFSLEEQLKTIEEDIPIYGVKIGMIYSKRQVIIIHDFLKRLLKKASIPIVLDPLMNASTGKILCREETRRKMEKYLFKYMTIITPNRIEVETLLGCPIKTINEMREASQALGELYGTSILIKGGHFTGKESVDVLYDGIQLWEFPLERKKYQHTHGTGCALSTSICCHLSMRESLEDSVRKGKAFVANALKHGYSIGNGEGPVDSLLHLIHKEEMIDV